MHLMAIDGNSLVNRAFYGVRPLSAADGTPTNAVYGFLNMLLKLREDYSPDEICVCFDLKAPTFRHKAYAGYKAQRKPMPQELADQMPLVKAALDGLGIPRMEVEGYEADDLLGTLSCLCARQGGVTTIVTGDRDSLQYVTGQSRVALVTTRMGQTSTELYDEQVFAEKYRGLAPGRIVDLKAIMGDSSDNIPGVRGIGEKGALDLICRFGSLQGVLHAAPEELTSVEGVGENAAVLVRLVGDMALRARCSSLPQKVLNSPDRTGAYFMELLAGEKKEMGKEPDC